MRNKPCKHGINNSGSTIEPYKYLIFDLTANLKAEFLLSQILQTTKRA